MMENKFIGLMVGLTVGVLMVSGFLWPIVSDATASDETFTNDGYFRMTRYNTTDNLSMSWTYEKPEIITVNNVDVPIGIDPTLPNRQITVVADTDWVVRMSFSANGDVIGLNYLTDQGSIIRASVSNSATVSMTFENGAMTAQFGTSTIEKSYTDLYLPSLDGNFVMKKYNETAYITAESEVLAYGMTEISGSYLAVSISGTYDNLENRIWRGTANFTVSNTVASVEENTAYVGLYELNTITFDATNISSEVSSAVTYSYFLVPYEITVEKSWHLDTTQVALVAAIGTLGAIVLIAAAAGSIRRLD